MSRETAKILLASTVAFAALAILAWLLLDRQPEESAPSVAPTAAEIAPELGTMTLLFPSNGGRLAAESRQAPPAAQPEERIRQVVEALLAGPQESGHLAPLPDGISLGTVLLAVDGTAFLDLITPEGRGTPPWGSKQELLAVYSLVNTVITNEPRARRVTLLWNGQQRPTFAGHVDLTRPLVLHSGLIAPAPTPAAGN